MRRNLLLVALAGAAVGQDCQDIALSNGGVWHSGNQVEQTCATFRQNGWCPEYKNCCTKNENMDPERACCGCGGGCTDAQVRLANGAVVAWTGRDGAGCDAWADRCNVGGSEGQRMHGLLPSEACCACGGGGRWRPDNAANPAGDWSRVDLEIATATPATPVTPVTPTPPAVVERTCSSHACPEGFVSTPGAANTLCTNNVCGNFQCCTATCRQHSCTGGWEPNWDLEFVACTNGVCTTEQCCVAPEPTGPSPVSVPSFCQSHTALSGTTGTLSHPANGGEYANNEGACWSIACSGSLEVAITRIDLEATYDFLYIYRLPSTGAEEQLGRHDGTQPPPPTTVDGNALVRFTSDTGVTQTGFALSWACGAGAPGPVTGPAPVTGGGGLPACGGECTDRAGPNGQAWNDADGAEYSCEYYTTTAGACEDYGDDFANFGFTANQACCGCGGGRGGSSETPAASGLSPSSLPSSNGCGPRIRLPWSTLSCEEKQRYLDAVAILYTDASLRQQVTDFVETHVAQFPYAHSTSAFLAWHRQYLIGYENLIRSIPRRHGDFACVTIPFWDWDRDAGSEHGSSVFRDTFGFGSEDTRRNPHCHRPGARECSFLEPECITTGPFAGMELFVRSATPENGQGEFVQDGCIQRAAGEFFVGTEQTGFHSTDDVALMIRSTPDFSQFREDFELEPHAMPHLYIGGTMASDASPADPMFLLHHCNVDRVYAVWQDYWGHDNVAKSDLCAAHYTPTDDLADLEFGRENLNLDIDAVMPMEMLDGGRMSTLRDRWTVREVHHIHDMPGGNSYAYGDDALAHMLNSDPAFWGTVIPRRSRAVQECGRRTERAAAEQAQADAPAAHYTSAELNAMSAESVRAAEALEWSSEKRMCELVQAACDAGVAHGSLSSTPKLRATATKMFMKSTHDKKAINKALRKCGVLENALQWCKEM